MTAPRKKYQRCKKCKELVNDVENCANCEHRDTDRSFRRPLGGIRKSPNLDQTEGNSEEYFG